MYRFSTPYSTCSADERSERNRLVGCWRVQPRSRCYDALTLVLIRLYWLGSVTGSALRWLKSLRNRLSVR